MSDINRQWILARRPSGPAKREDFDYREEPLPSSWTLAPGHIVVRQSVFLHAPTMRNWMDAPSNSLYPSVDLGSPMLSTSAGEVVASANPRFPVGSRVTTIGFWQDYSVVNADVMPCRPVDDDLTLIEALGVVGMNALTAYMGVMKVGRPQPGDVAVVSGAAGSTGSIAGQLLKIQGCTVIGIAGSADKCARLTSDLGFDHAIDYRTENVEARIREFAPAGVNVFFDNVGGDMLQAVVENTAKFCRIILCGQIAGYTGSAPVPGPTNMMRIIYGSVTLQGFLLGDYEEDIPTATRQLRTWVESGQLKHKEDLREGFDALPSTFSDLFSGANDGTLMVVTADEARERRS